MLQGGETAVPPEFRVRRGTRHSKPLTRAHAGTTQNSSGEFLPAGRSGPTFRSTVQRLSPAASSLGTVLCVLLPFTARKQDTESSDYLNFLHYTRADSVCQLPEEGIPWHFRPDFRRFAHKLSYFRSSQSQAESAATLPSPTAFASCRGFPVQSPAANTPGTAVAMCRSTTMPPFS